MYRRRSTMAEVQQRDLETRDEKMQAAKKQTERQGLYVYND